jgi:toxin ParE1/3/4
VPRSFRVEVTRTAERDILANHAHIARDNPTAAAAWLDTIERNIMTLEQWPRRCPVIPEALDLNIEYRHLVNPRYRTIVRIVRSRVIIVRVIHGAQLLDFDILEGAP